MYLKESIILYLCTLVFGLGYSLHSGYYCHGIVITSMLNQSTRLLYVLHSLLVILAIMGILLASCCFFLLLSLFTVLSHCLFCVFLAQLFLIIYFILLPLLSLSAPSILILPSSLLPFCLLFSYFLNPLSSSPRLPFLFFLCLPFLSSLLSFQFLLQSF